MVLSFDPVAQALVVDLEDGRPRFEVAAAGLVVKYYGHGGILFAEAVEGGIEIGYHPFPEHPNRPRLVTTPVWSWLVAFDDN